MTWLRSNSWDDLPSNERYEWLEKAEYLVNNHYVNKDVYSTAKRLFEIDKRKQNGNNKSS
jgi:hypothetical protein